MTNEVSSNVERAQQLVACLSVGGLSGLKELCHEELLMELPFAADPAQQRTEGREACLEKLAYVEEAFDHFAITPHEIYEAPTRDAVIVEATSFGRYKGGGAFYQNLYVIVLSFQDGKVVSWREYFDPQRVG